MYNYTPLTNVATSIPAIVARSVIASRNSETPPSENLTNTALATTAPACVQAASRTCYHDSYSCLRTDGALFHTGMPSPFCGTLGLIVWHNDCVLKDDFRESWNSSNKKCTVMQKQSFSCKIKLHRSQIDCNKITQVQMKQLWPGVGVSFKR